jgi:hypothetical protein
VIASAIQRLPRDCDPSTRRRGEEFLIEQARAFDPDALARLGRHLARALDPDCGADLEDEEARRADTQEFTLTQGRGWTVGAPFAAASPPRAEP